ncbi:DUF559 domain-containing protein [Mycobacterium sp. M1]|uniref:DUF559 domain-containing protein n=1 Tax=Mycolicibacter acidiphilus TaxID=2835306 RepID=A0ABS5RQG6_9MYCO|nr:DUF559 domain-containing protein [Mycolicibacter acidiphilus]MBS9535204.1 DUF559 domain-containing protein [Mycolicibacter acidiphilus]
MVRSFEPFLGSEALADGLVNRHQLRTRYRAVLPNVYLPNQVRPTLRQRTVAAWLWSDRQAIVAGAAAAALYGTRWIDDDSPIELIHPGTRAPEGVITRRDTVFADEVQSLALPVGTLSVTTPARTAFDIGRCRPIATTIARLDALGRAAGLNPGAVSAIALRHPHTRRLRQLPRVLDLVDTGAESPQESFLRLRLIDAGFPRPQTQIPVITAEDRYYIDMGWAELMVGVEYDGEHHRTDPVQYARDLRRAETLAALGWLIIRVIKGHRGADIVRRVARARQSRL